MKLGKFKLTPFFSVIGICVGLSVLLLTVVLVQRAQVYRSKASTPTGTATMCFKPYTATVPLASYLCSDSTAASSTFTTIFDPDTPTINAGVDVNSIFQGIAAIGVQINIPSTYVNKPTASGSATFNTLPWTQNFLTVSDAPVNGQWIIQYSAYYNRSTSAGPNLPVLGNNLSDQRVLDIIMPVKPQTTIPASMTWTATFDANGSFAQLADVNSSDVLKTPINRTFLLNKDTVAPTVTINSGPADGATVTTSTPVTYTYSATDNVTATNKLVYSTQFDTTPQTTYVLGLSSFTTPTLAPGTHTIKIFARDSSGTVGQATRTLTYTAPPASVLLRVKFAGISTDKGPLDAQVLIRPITKLNPSSWILYDSTTSAGIAHFAFANGAYQTNLTNLQLSTGIYDILVKGPSSIRSLVTRSTNGVTLSSNVANTVDRTVGGTQATLDQDTVRGGDVCKVQKVNPACTTACSTECVDGQDGNITIGDLIAVSSRYTESFVPVYYPVSDRSSNCPTTTTTTLQPISVPSRVDSNLDCFISITDLTLISNNYTSTSVQEDQ